MTIIKWVNYLFGISFKVTYILLVIFYFVAAVRKYSVFCKQAEKCVEQIRRDKEKFFLFRVY